MKELHFEYRMKLAFDTPVCQHRFTLKCTPTTNERQEIIEIMNDIYPKEFLATSRDSFGNSCIYGYSDNCRRSNGTRYGSLPGLFPYFAFPLPYGAYSFTIRSRNVDRRGIKSCLGRNL